MPDLDQIKQAEQGVRDRLGRFAKGRDHVNRAARPLLAARARCLRQARGHDVLPKIGCRTWSPGAMPRCATVPPFSSITARTGAAAAITSND